MKRKTIVYILIIICIWTSLGGPQKYLEHKKQVSGCENSTSFNITDLQDASKVIKIMRCKGSLINLNYSTLAPLENEQEKYEQSSYGIGSESKVEFTDLLSYTCCEEKSVYRCYEDQSYTQNCERIISFMDITEPIKWYRGASGEVICEKKR